MALEEYWRKRKFEKFKVRRGANFY